ncbi:uncharacterized protein SCDLUD_003584 [Saccharomycodes ludwigii]|uniref:uncharacterized protein n=1 Tax=Saccharomycodes ludwigii TaxID=36035 RepID=UPI001E8AE666|nr:hypothetical protein SCDLUD_003584 [Saccharomycodes ludwigii]KAH3900592.1 hypothetical protein SCDLUD_003584 [Saccharomycodes ludwigii]
MMSLIFDLGKKLTSEIHNSKQEEIKTLIKKREKKVAHQSLHHVNNYIDELNQNNKNENLLIAEVQNDWQLVYYGDVVLKTGLNNELIRHNFLTGIKDKVGTQSSNKVNNFFQLVNATKEIATTPSLPLVTNNIIAKEKNVFNGDTQESNIINTEIKSVNNGFEDYLFANNYTEKHNKNVDSVFICFSSNSKIALNKFFVAGKAYNEDLCGDGNKTIGTLYQQETNNIYDIDKNVGNNESSVAEFSTRIYPRSYYYKLIRYQRNSVLSNNGTKLINDFLKLRGLSNYDKQITERQNNYYSKYNNNTKDYNYTFDLIDNDDSSGFYFTRDEKTVRCQKMRFRQKYKQIHTRLRLKY